MKMKEYCNNTYRDLIAKLGELSIQKTLIDKQIAEIGAQIHLLNALSPDLQKIEQSITSDNE